MINQATTVTKHREIYLFANRITGKVIKITDASEQAPKGLIKFAGIETQEYIPMTDLFNEPALYPLDNSITYQLDDGSLVIKRNGNLYVPLPEQQLLF